MRKKKDIEEFKELFKACFSNMKVQNVEVWSKLNLTMPQIKILFLIHCKGKLPVTKLASHLGVRVPNITFVLDHLVERGLVRREVDPKDRRVVLSSLTKLGEKVIKDLSQARFEALGKALAGMSLMERESLKFGLMALCRELREVRKEAGDLE
jgi:DNA-binding MarR family transcriptional regulator